MWFTPHEILTKQRLFNFIIGPRGNGKTTGLKNYCLTQHFKNQDFQVGWIRRYDTETKETKKHFFDGIENFGFECEGKIKGRTGFIDNVPFVHFFTLSKDARIKGANYPNIQLIVFDEFLLNTKNSRYLNDEVNEFLSLYDSVARPSDPNRKRVPVVFIANSMSISNPYFNYFKIIFNNGKYQTKEIYAEILNTPEFTEYAKSTSFAKIIQGSTYAEHSFENEFLLDNNSFINPEFKKDQYLYTFVYKGKNYGVWVNWKEGTLFISNKYDPFCKNCFYFSKEDRTPNYLSCKLFKDTYHGKITKQCYNTGSLYFENQQIKTLWYDIARLANL